MRSQKRAFASVAVVLGLLATAACTKSVPPQEASLVGEPPIVTTPAPISPETLAARGTVVSQHAFHSSSDALTAAAGTSIAAEYHSTDGSTGKSTVVSGAFFVPPGTPPRGGWPVIAFAHGTTGIGHGCGPSMHDDLLGLSDSIASTLKQKYAVAITDYQGLGRTGVHPYLEPRTAGYNVIDSVRALRELDPSASPRWLAMGGSQGGQAAWAADEVAGTYGTGLDLVGAVALAPAVDISRIPDLAWNSALSDQQTTFMPMIVVGASRVDPTITVSDYLSPTAEQKLGDLTGCDQPRLVAAATSLDENDVRPRSRAAADRLRDRLRRNALPQQKLDAPLLVLNGDRDEVVLPTWVEAAVTRGCAMGDEITHRVVPGANHTDLGPDQQAISWIQARFAGAAASSTCSR